MSQEYPNIAYRCVWEWNIKKMLVLLNRPEGIDMEPTGTGIPAVEIDEFIRKNNIDLIVTAHGRSGLHQRLAKVFTIDADAVPM